MKAKPLRILCAFNEHSKSHEWLPMADPTFDLKEAGHEVTLVHSCSWLRKKLQDSVRKKYQPYDIVLADYYLPENRGEKLYYSTEGLQEHAKDADVKCCGIFAPDHKIVAPEFKFDVAKQTLFILSGGFRTPMQERDVLSMLEYLLDNWNAAVEVEDEQIAELTSGLDEIDLTDY